MTQIIFPARYIVEAAAFCSRLEFRSQIAGIALWQMDSGAILLVATDGHRLACFRPKEQLVAGAVSCGERGSANCLVLTPSKAVLAACRRPPIHKRCLRWARLDLEQRRLAVVQALSPERAEAEEALPGDVVENALDEAAFPDWTRVVPTGPLLTGPRGQFNGDYIASFARLARSPLADSYAHPGAQLGIYAPAGEHPESCAHLVRIPTRPDVFGALMPYRDVPARNHLPDWCAHG